MRNLLVVCALVLSFSSCVTMGIQSYNVATFEKSDLLGKSVVKKRFMPLFSYIVIQTQNESY